VATAKDGAATVIRSRSRKRFVVIRLQASHQVFLMAPVLCVSPLSQPGCRLAQCGRFQYPCQIGDLSGHIAALGSFGGGHQATPPSTLAARRRCTVVNKPEHLLLPILWPAFGLQVFNLSGAEIYLFSQIA